MDFWDLTKLMFRRWYVATPLLVVALGAAAWTSTVVQPDYKATSYIQLIPPPAASTAKASELRNPWLDLGLGSLNTAATYATIDKTFLNQLTTKGLSDNVVITTGYPAPIATIEVIGSSQSQATATMEEVVRRFDETVKALQDGYGVPAAGMVLTRRLDTGQNLAETGGKVKRALIAVAGAGMLMAAALTIAFDAVARRRARRRAQRLAGEDGGAPVAGIAASSTAAGIVWRRSRQTSGRRSTDMIDVERPGSSNAEATVALRVPGRRQPTDPAARPSGSEDPAPIGMPDSDMTVVLPRASLELPVADSGSKQR